MYETESDTSGQTIVFLRTLLRTKDELKKTKQKHADLKKLEPVSESEYQRASIRERVSESEYQRESIR